jgi:hypothetical protein
MEVEKVNKNRKGVIVLILNIIIMICNTVIGKIDTVNVENVSHETTVETTVENDSHESSVGIIAHEMESLYMEV